MTLREATAADVAAVVALEHALFGADAWSEAQVREELTGERRQAWVVGEPVVGYAVTLAVGDVVDLQRIGVHPDHPRQGLARRLLDEAVAAGKAAQVDRMLLEVSAANTAALAFYAAAGFVEIDRRRRYYRDGTDAVVMRLPLASAACGGRG
jgi:ribosomal-protein-alanine N-acetyltransferase